MSQSRHASTARPTLQSIFSQHRRLFEREHGAGLSPQQWLALRKITACRTPVLGGKAHACADCGCVHELYHSCNHRLCPQCGGRQAHEWCERQCEHLLPGVDYFMVTFTLPGSLRGECRGDERTWYDRFFACSSNALMELMADDKSLGGAAGFFGVLQTWRRDLGYHLHIHYIVPGGVLVEEKRSVHGQRKRELHRRWRPCRRGPGGPYLLNACALQIAMRKRMERSVKERQPELHARLPRSLWRQSWRIDMKHVGSGREVIRYLARYVSKSAISNPQLIHSTGERVSYSHTPGGSKHSKRKTLEAHDFMKQVLQHALPEGFKRIRYYGWQHPAAKQRLEHIKLLVGKPLIYQQKQDQAPEPKSRKTQLKCRKCQGEQFQPARDIPPLNAASRHLWELIVYGPAQLGKAPQAGMNPRHNGSRAPPACETQS